MTPLKLPVAKKPWIMVGRYHICMGAAGIGTRPIRMVTYIMSGIIIEFSHNGIIRIGFHTTGAPNTIGSLMLKIAGKMVTSPMAFSLLHLDLMQRITRVRVAPCPPM